MNRLGMYVHMHWGYNHPYAARTWTIEDWRSYASGLSALGYNMVMIWPMLETMPDPLTPSDVAFLGKIGQVIDLLHNEFGMQVIITMGANTIGNDKAAEYEFENRPFFKTDLRLNPGDPVQLDRLMEVRRNLLSYLKAADGYFIIDSDPGGYIGSTSDDFVHILWRHLDLIKGYNPNATLYYWMHVGWEPYNKMWKEVEENHGPVGIYYSAADFEAVIGRLMERPEEPWAVTSGIPEHQEAVEKFGIQNRTMFYRYGIVEGEPTFPVTNYDPEPVQWGMSWYSPSKMHLGAMANAQSHVLQLPNTYFYSHYFRGGTIDDIDITAFAEKLIPGKGELISAGWQSFNAGDTSRMRDLASRIASVAADDLPIGQCGGLLMGSPKRFLNDLSLQLMFRAGVTDFIAAMESGSEWREPLVALAGAWRAWQQQTGFTDAYGDVLGIHPALRKLGDPTIGKVLDDFDDWGNPSVRHGILLRLLDAIDAKAES